VTSEGQARCGGTWALGGQMAEHERLSSHMSLRATSQGIRVHKSAIVVANIYNYTFTGMILRIHVKIKLVEAIVASCQLYEHDPNGPYLF